MQTKYVTGDTLDFLKQFSQHVAVLSEINSQTVSFHGLLAESTNRSPFLAQCLQFSRIAMETQDAIVRLLEAGHIAQSYVLLRWYLELANLSFFLWQDQNAFEKWFRGDQVKPWEARKFIHDSGFQSLGSAYSDWSSVSHCNSVFVKAFHAMAQLSPESEMKEMLIGNALNHLICLSQRFNYMIGKVAQLHSGAKANDLISNYNCLNDRVLALSKEQLDIEKRLMDKKD